MEWLETLLFSKNIAHTVFLYALVISGGVLLGKIRFFGISLGVTFVLFTGLLAGHLGFGVDPHILHFIREFGLILFIFSIGLQVGPGFFSSFKKGGMTLNLLATTIVLLGVGTTILIYYLLPGGIDMPMLVGVLSGAVTNTPGLGAAQEALHQLMESGAIEQSPDIALGYAVAYPLGVTGIILAMILLRFAFRVDLKQDHEAIVTASETQPEQPEFISVRLTNPQLEGKTLLEVKKILDNRFVASRMMREGVFSVPMANTRLSIGDTLFIITTQQLRNDVLTLLGEEYEIDWKASDSLLVSRRIVITKDNINGKSIRDLNFRAGLGVNITRINRSGIDLLATPDLVLQVGDRVMAVGEEDALKKVEDLLGNTLKRLDHPHIFSFFTGICLGVLLGSIPFFIPGIPMPVKLGLAGGPLVVAILLGRFGYKLKLVTYTTQSANLMLREIGISLFLASVGLASGGRFVETVLSAQGITWVACGFLITLLPLLITGGIARRFLKLNYYSLMGLLAGSMTDPPALAYAGSISENDAPAVSYSTVYPLTMFLRVISAQVLILSFA